MVQLALLCLCLGLAKGKSIDDYLAARKVLLEAENENFLGSELNLSTVEREANAHLMTMRQLELSKGFATSDFLPAKSFFEAKPTIEQSQVFQFIKGLPKGGVLHTHDFAITSSDWVIQNVTYREGLYISSIEGGQDLKFGWFSQDPTPSKDDWIKVSYLRSIMGNREVDKALTKHLSIVVQDPEDIYPDVNAVWSKFQKVFMALGGLLTYVPVATDYFYQGFKEFYEDNVKYMEIRTTLPPLCHNMDECENPTSPVETAIILKKVAEQFMNDHPDDFCGIHMIYAPLRNVATVKVEEYLETAMELTHKLSGFCVGFDLVGQEDLGKPLIEFAETILNGVNGTNLKFFFHAGETDWQGSPTDLNIIDALLLNTSRIGHGYAITKHPEAMSLAIEKDIPIEVCPISNQVLGLVDDLRNHPIAPLIQLKFPMVISCDDPGIWGAKGLSYDFYEAFMAMASWTMDLRLLKKLALNSIKYSALENDQKDKCFAIWETEWNDYMKSQQRPKSLPSTGISSNLDTVL